MPIGGVVTGTVLNAAGDPVQADYEVPDRIEVREELPLNAMFKVDKRALHREPRRDLPRKG